MPLCTLRKEAAVQLVSYVTREDTEPYERIVGTFTNVASNKGSKECVGTSYIADVQPH